MGGAGSGKTFQLMETLGRFLVERPLDVGQKVLALTFMHGSRRRLDERLQKVSELSGRYECTTLDSFAWRIVRRWRSLCEQLGFPALEPGDYSRVIEAAAAVLEIDTVSKWVAGTFPVLVLDEAQDLTVSRLRIVSALAAYLDVLSAADEFQCLDETLRPNPACAWLEQVGNVQVLVDPRRTQVAELIEAATALRSGLAPQSGNLLKIQLTSNVGLAGTWLSNQIGWYGGGKSVAVITPVAGNFARGVIEWVRSRTTSRNCGPYSIQWEQAYTETTDNYLSALLLGDEADAPQVIAAVQAANDHRVTTDVGNWLDRQRRTRGRSVWQRVEIEQVVRQSFYLRRRQNMTVSSRLSAMTIHGAKNREFDIAIVLWPAATMGSDDQKRRLLYNAITRAKERCLVLVQAQANLAAAPFS